MINNEKWNDWKWQLNHSIRSFKELEKYYNLAEGDFEPSDKNSLPFSITPFLATRLGNEAIMKQFIPLREYTTTNEEFTSDYLAEEDFQPVPNLLHKYENRVAILITNNCAAYCRYCTRKRIVGKQKRKNELTDAIEYIKKHEEIKDVLITGGDPLVLDDLILDSILTEIEKIEHVRLIRIGTRTPITLPMRITDNLISILKNHQPLYINIHVNHPSELCNETNRAINALADAGIPLGSQTVLLRNINNNEATLTELFTNLTYLRVKPYYLYECDKVQGCEGYWVSPIEGRTLINSLNGKISGMAVPKFVIDMPGIFGKQIMAPCNLLNFNSKSIKFANYKNEIAKYLI